MTVIELTDNNFDETLRAAELPLLVDFWAPWCGPCKTLAPVLEDLSEESASTFVIGKVNIEINPETAARFGVMSLPTLMLFRNGQPVMTAVGPASKAEIRRKVVDRIDR